MKKSIVLASMLLGSSLFASGIQPYVGVSYNNFDIDADYLNIVDKSTGTTITAGGESSDSGSTAGFVGGVIISDSSKINVSYFSGKEEDSEILTATTLGISYDYNILGSHKGFIVGLGVVNTEVEIDAVAGAFDAQSNSSTSVLYKIGYEYITDSGLFFEINYSSLGSIDDIAYDYTANTNYEWQTEFSVSAISFSLSYAF